MYPSAAQTRYNMQTIDVMESVLGLKGWLVMKTFYGPETQKLRTFLESRFYKVKKFCSLRPTRGKVSGRFVRADPMLRDQSRGR